MTTRKWRSEVSAALLAAADALSKVKASSDSEFWRIIKSLRWDGRNRNFAQMHKGLLVSLRPEEVAYLAETFSKKMKEMRKRIEYFEEQLELDGLSETHHLEITDGTFLSLLSTIIGLGEDEYDAVMKNPLLAFERAAKRKYLSFYEAIPRKEESAKLDVSTYVEWAKGVIEENPTPKSPAGQEAVDTIANAMKIMIGGDVKKFLQTERDVTDAAKLLRKENGINEFFITNLYADIKRFLG